MLKSKVLLLRRRDRLRIAQKRNNKDASRLRLSVFRSQNNIYAQIIDDINACTLVSASTLDKEVKAKIKSGANIDAATVVGALLAERAVKKEISKVYFDRGGYLYHGRVKALADSARLNGLNF